MSKKNGKLTDLYRKHRPSCFTEVVGQESVVNQLRGFLKNNTLPHALLLSGGSGSGKTSVARILKKELKCSDMDFCEINAAESRGIDTVRDIASRINLYPVTGPCRIYLLDEVHELSKRQGGNAQEALLKVLEEVPSHAYFFLCTTNPQGLLETVRGRCTKVGFKSLTTELLRTVVEGVAGKEEITLTEEVTGLIVEQASQDGGARAALNLLGQIAGVDDEEERITIIRSAVVCKTVEFLGKLLLNRKKTWPDVAKVLRDTDEDPEGLRRGILGYASKVLLSGEKVNGRAAAILEVFGEKNLFDSGKPGLVFMCLRVVDGG